MLDRWSASFKHIRARGILQTYLIDLNFLESKPRMKAENLNMINKMQKIKFQYR